METFNNCRSCIFYDECGGDELCEYYFNTEDPDEMNLNEYETDLAMRVCEYNDLLAEYRDTNAEEE